MITNPDGSVVFQMDGAEMPAAWSQLATDIVVSKYFRKAGLHGKNELDETSVRQVVHRLARTIRASGEKDGGYFDGPESADAFEAELSFPGGPRPTTRPTSYATVTTSPFTTCARLRASSLTTSVTSSPSSFRNVTSRVF